MSRRLIIDCVLLAVAFVLLAINIFYRPTPAPVSTNSNTATTTTIAATTTVQPHTKQYLYSPPISTAAVAFPVQQTPTVYTVTNNIPVSSGSPPPSSSASPSANQPVSNPSTATPPTPTNPPTSSGTWSNAPANFSVISNYAFAVPIPTTLGSALPDNSGWSESYGDRELLSIVPDPTAPLSPIGVLQFSYPVGWQTGSAPGLMYHELPHVRKFYVGFYWKPSQPWQGNDDNVNKIVFLDLQNSQDNSDSNLDMVMYGTPGGPYELRIAAEIPPVTQWLDDRGPFFGTPVTGTWNHTNVTLGAWHKVEILADMDAGKVEYWLDGVQIGNVNYAFPSTDSFIEFQFSPTFGGGGNPKTENDYYWFDSVHLAGN